MRLAEASRYCQVSAPTADLPAIDLPTPFTVLFRQNGDRSLLRHPIAMCAGAGMLTCYPSASPFGYTLGPD